MLIDVALFSLLGIGYDAAGYGTGNLPAQYIHALRGGDHRVGMLVLLARLRQPCLHELSVLVLHELHLAIHRKPVGMYVPEAHEDGNHQSPVVEVRCILHFLYHYDLAVGRSYHEFLGIFHVQESDRASVEVEHDTIYYTEDHKECPETVSYTHLNEAENRVVLLKNGEGATKRQKLKEDVQFIATRMKQNKELLAKLQKQLANSSIQGDQLKKTIENLQKQLVCLLYTSGKNNRV